jgi:hypothetical protein
MTDRISNNLIGIAGIHYVVSELSRRGMIALPTVRDVAAYDVIGANVEGTRGAVIGTPWFAGTRLRSATRASCSLWSPGPEEVKRELERQATKVKPDHKRVNYFAALPVDHKAGGRERHWANRWKTWKL